MNRNVYPEVLLRNIVDEALYSQGYPLESIKREFRTSNNNFVDYGIIDNLTQNLIGIIECIQEDRIVQTAFEQVKRIAKDLTSTKLFVIQNNKDNFEIYTTPSVKDTFYRIPQLPEYSALKDKGQAEAIKFNLDEINAELIKYLARHPSIMYDMSPRKFEELVAELFRDMGYKVYLTPQTRDGGRDVIAVMKVPPNKECVTIVECKRYGFNNHLGIDIVERFIYTVREKDKANAGLIATTSYFSREAQNLQEKYKWLLSLNDFENLKEWLGNYGQWNNHSRSEGIWLPTNPLD